MDSNPCKCSCSCSCTAIVTCHPCNRTLGPIRGSVQTPLTLTLPTAQGRDVNSATNIRRALVEMLLGHK
mgnify:CR=1 FL=1